MVWGMETNTNTTPEARTMIPMIKVHYPKGQAPHTDSVEFQNAQTHIAARDHLATEAMVLLAFASADVIPQTITVPGSRWELVMDFCGSADYAKVG